MLKSSPLALKRHLCWKEVWVPLSQWQMVRAVFRAGRCIQNKLVFVSKKTKSRPRCVRSQVSSGGCGRRVQMSVVKVACEREECANKGGREGDRKEGEHMGRRLGQYIPFSVSRGECQEPDPKSSAMRSLDSSIKMLHLYHRYPARYIFSFGLALLPHAPSLLWK